LRQNRDPKNIESPGHTAGHVSYYHHPTRTLFAGDSLAVVNGSLRRMARPVTPNPEVARESMKKSLDRDIAIICPGHREPLSKNVNEERKHMLSSLNTQAIWPLFG
jgi:glyoxylase-like metal-dependent hydrolase (beta-lactamase superfamily II)